MEVVRLGCGGTGASGWTAGSAPSAPDASCKMEVVRPVEFERNETRKETRNERNAQRQKEEDAQRIGNYEWTDIKRSVVCDDK